MDAITVPRPALDPGVTPARPRALVEARGLTRVWGAGHGASRALDGVDLELGSGEFVAIVGPSGSGKSTLGALLAGIDKPTSGSLVIGGVRLDRMREDALARWRSRHLGIVLQDFSLLPTLTAAENVELGLKLAGIRKDRRRRAREALARVGLGGLARRLPCSSRVASSSASPSHAPSRGARRSSWPTSRPAASTPRTARSSSD